MRDIETSDLFVCVRAIILIDLVRKRKPNDNTLALLFIIYILFLYALIVFRFKENNNNFRGNTFYRGKAYTPIFVKFCISTKIILKTN